MTDPVSNAASSALAELLEVSPQVDAAVILERDGGRTLASAPAASDRMASRLGDTCAKILAAAERARTELGREPVSQIEVATPDGHVFVVADSTWIVAAVTDADPTVGLVFYDLKTALRSVREARTSNGDSAPTGSGTTPAPPSLVSTTPIHATAPGDDATSDGDEDTATGAPQAASRWRRRKS